MRSRNNKVWLAELYRENNSKVGVEVGVDSGKFTEKLCEVNPDAKIYGVDTWEVYGGYCDKDNIPARQDHFNAKYAYAKRRLKGLNCVLIKGYSMDVVNSFADDSLDFVFIDGNHTYPYVKEDIEAWTKKVKPGGVVSGHDYDVSERKNYGVIEAVNEYIGKSDYKLEIVNLRGKKKQPKCWYFIK